MSTSTVTVGTAAPRTPAHSSARRLPDRALDEALWRQPAFAVATLIQPIIWLLLFGALFQGVADIPGFAAEHGTTWSSSPPAWW